MPVRTVFTSSIAFEPERVHGLALYCSDGRFGDAVDEFLHDHLDLPNYDRLTVPGGPAWLGFRGDASLGQYGMIREQLDFLVKVHALERVVLIAHYGCAWYSTRSQGDAESLLPLQYRDLKDAASTIRNWYSRLTVETYLAHAIGDEIRFESVPSAFK